MSLLVHKYGGTSVGTLARIQAVAQRIISDRLQGYEVVVVVSAMAGETDRLLHLANSLQLEPEGREYAALLCTGEQVTAALLSMALQQQGHAARSYSGCQIPIYTDNHYKMAEIQRIDTDVLYQDLDCGLIPIVAGFQGISEAGYMTTLGRGGSDYTAIALAAALGSVECKIFTDVEGVYTSDPKVDPQAKLLKFIDIETMLCMAAEGAKVLQLRAVELAYQYRVPLRVLSSFTTGEGTVICYPQDLLAKQG